MLTLQEVEGGDARELKVGGVERQASAQSDEGAAHATRFADGVPQRLRAGKIKVKNGVGILLEQLTSKMVYKSS